MIQVTCEVLNWLVYGFYIAHINNKVLRKKGVLIKVINIQLMI